MATPLMRPLSKGTTTPVAASVSRADLAQALGTEEVRMFSWIRQLGRPESRFGITVFQRHDEGAYLPSQAMHDAVTQLLAAAQDEN
jgi:hypothetical protein